MSVKQKGLGGPYPTTLLLFKFHFGKGLHQTWLFSWALSRTGGEFLLMDITLEGEAARC